MIPYNEGRDADGDSRAHVEQLVSDLLQQLRTWQDLPDARHVLASLAVAVTAGSGDSEPAWLLLVAPPSSGKTETVRLLDDVAEEHLGEVTVGGLLSWRKRPGKSGPVASGVLTRVHNGLVTFGDLSTLLASSDRGGRDQVFSILRRVYDGEVQRDVAPPSGSGAEPLKWHGRINVVGAVTEVIDQYAAHADALGSRWLYFRLPTRTTAQKRDAAALARRPGLAKKRKDARPMAAAVVKAARLRLSRVESIPDRVIAAIEDAALVCCWGRAAVPRNGYGAREIDGPAVVEDPPRLMQQLLAVARGLVALGSGSGEAATICCRLAVDSMPATRRAVLDALTIDADNASTANIAQVAGLHRAVARRTLEELEVVGIIVGTRIGPEPDDDRNPDRRPCYWRLTEGDGDVVKDVFKKLRDERQR